MRPTEAPPDLRLATARLVLRPPAPRDLATIAAALGDLAVSRTLARVPHPYAEADAAAWFAAARLRMTAGEDLQLTLLADDAVIGGIGIRDLRGPAELGYWIARPHWGSGFATEALHAALDHGFGALGLRRVTSGVFADNPASLRVQDKLGFERTGISQVFCLARGATLAHIDTMLPRERFRMGRS